MSDNKKIYKVFEYEDKWLPHGERRTFAFVAAYSQKEALEKAGVSWENFGVRHICKEEAEEELKSVKEKIEEAEKLQGQLVYVLYDEP